MVGLKQAVQLTQAMHPSEIELHAAPHVAPRLACRRFPCRASCYHALLPVIPMHSPPTPILIACQPPASALVNSWSVWSVTLQEPIAGWLQANW